MADDRLVLGDKMREIPLHEGDRLRLATPEQVVEAAWKRMSNVHNQWLEGAIYSEELANALVVAAVELSETLQGITSE